MVDFASAEKPSLKTTIDAVFKADYTNTIPTNTAENDAVNFVKSQLQDKYKNASFLNFVWGGSNLSVTVSVKEDFSDDTVDLKTTADPLVFKESNDDEPVIQGDSSLNDFFQSRTLDFNSTNDMNDQSILERLVDQLGSNDELAEHFNKEIKINYNEKSVNLVVTQDFHATIKGVDHSFKLDDKYGFQVNIISYQEINWSVWFGASAFNVKNKDGLSDTHNAQMSLSDTNAAQISIRDSKDSSGSLISSDNWSVTSSSNLIEVDSNPANGNNRYITHSSDAQYGDIAQIKIKYGNEECIVYITFIK